jgi:diaminohydroxyphosphoribosylaminopyrimidine deaminase / 5-amino-6-(5-phosphoribosylamino)uracil reductase
METDEIYMSRCIELASLGVGHVAPNPMVGSVIVCNGKIIGEGFHQKYGQAHAEVNAVNSVTRRELLKSSVMYVSLEPCAHFGLTPPCADLIVREQIPKVVIGSADPFSEVAGKGIERLKKAGVEVKVGVLEKECHELNKRFFTFHTQKRPFVILKWAQTSDGFIDTDRLLANYGQPTWITGEMALRLVHKVRSEENAIMIGTFTAEKDNPHLTVRHWPGDNPLRILIDKNLRLPHNLNLFDGSVPTIIYNSQKHENTGLISWVKIDFQKNIVPQMLEELYARNILSLIVEGGKQLIDSFSGSGLWDEMHVYTGNLFFSGGVKAPLTAGKLVAEEWLDTDNLKIFRNND